MVVEMVERITLSKLYLQIAKELTLKQMEIYGRDILSYGFLDEPSKLFVANYEGIINGLYPDITSKAPEAGE